MRLWARVKKELATMARGFGLCMVAIGFAGAVFLLAALLVTLGMKYGIVGFIPLIVILVGCISWIIGELT